MNVGHPFVVSEYADSDSLEAAQAARESELLQQIQHEAVRNFFGDDYQPDQSAEEDAAPAIVSQGRSVLRFAEPANIKCNPEKIPAYPKDDYGKPGVPFGFYSSKASAACPNPPNVYLTWDNNKYKYCCDENPDPVEKMMKHAKDAIYYLLTNTTVDYKTAENLKYAIQKYMIAYKKLHTPEEVAIEREKTNALVQAFFVKLSRSDEFAEHNEKSQREERAEPMRAWEANTLSEWRGGRRRSRRRQLRIKRSLNRGKKSRRSRFRR